MQPPSTISGRYLIGTDDSLRPYEWGDAVHLHVAVANVLRRCVERRDDMRALRTQVANLQCAAHASTLSDVAVIDLTVKLVCCGRLRLIITERLPVVEGVPAEVPRPAPATPMPTSSAPRTARVEIVVPSFSAELDAAALVAVLINASKDGTPFCEECARAARAA